MSATLVDFSIRRIDSSPIRGVGPSKRRRADDEHAGFDLELEDARPAAPETPTEHSAETPFAGPDEDEAGGRLDVTA